jgi:hypothetical protein
MWQWLPSKQIQHLSFPWPILHTTFHWHFSPCCITGCNEKQIPVRWHDWILDYSLSTFSVDCTIQNTSQAICHWTRQIMGRTWQKKRQRWCPVKTLTRKGYGIKRKSRGRQITMKQLEEIGCENVNWFRMPSNVLWKYRILSTTK